VLTAIGEQSFACLASTSGPLLRLYVREFRVKDATFLADKRPRLRYWLGGQNWMAMALSSSLIWRCREVMRHYRGCSRSAAGKFFREQRSILDAGRPHARSGDEVEGVVGFAISRLNFKAASWLKPCSNCNIPLHVITANFHAGGSGQGGP
jgi:hypothetical protein